MRKALFILFLLAVGLFVVSASADTAFPLESCSGTVMIDETSYIVLTPSTLSDHPDLLATLGRSLETTTADWAARGVQLQAWTRKMDACLEITVVQDEESARYFDTERQSRETRQEYLALHKGASSKFAAQGWTITNLDWKKQKLGGNFLTFEYKRTSGDRTIRGVARKTVRNGYTIMLDYQVYGKYPQERLPRSSDNGYLNKIANTVEFQQVEPGSSYTSSDGTAESGESGFTATVTGTAMLDVTAAPPEQTNTGAFKIEGTATPGLQVIAVAMRYSGSQPLNFTADVPKSGRFKVDVSLPEEGLWHITLNLMSGDNVVAEANFLTTTYSKILIPVTMDAEIPEEIPGDELILSGVTSGGVTVQCIVTNGTETFDKTITTNRTGVFRFKVPSSTEGEYDIALIFQKKNFSTVRKTGTANRVLSPAEILQNKTKKAVTASYANLTKKLDTYIGQLMYFNVYIVSVTRSGEEWLITVAAKKNNGYSNLMIFTAQEDPGLVTDSKVKIYGTCVGAHLIQSEEDGDVTLPSFDYLYHE